MWLAVRAERRSLLLVRIRASETLLRASGCDARKQSSSLAFDGSAIYLRRSPCCSVLAIFGFNVFLHKPVLDSFLFALALAVGLTPQLLPAIISDQSFARCAAHGAGEGDRETLGRDRKLRQHERALLGQDRHDHRGQDQHPRSHGFAWGNPSEKTLLLRLFQRRFRNRFRQSDRRSASGKSPS